MITGEEFKTEMLRTTRPDTARNALGLHIPGWMLTDGGLFSAERFQELYGETCKDIKTLEDLKAFADWLLEQNAAGKIRYFPKLSELKTALYNFKKHRDPGSVKERPPLRSWKPPVANPEHEQRMQQMLQWWEQLSEDEKASMRVEIVQKQVPEGMREYILEKQDWGGSVIARAYMLEYFGKHIRERVVI